MKRIFSLFALTIIFTITAAADIPPIKTPKPTPPPREIDAGLEIQLDNSAKDVKLIIPRDKVRALRAQLDEIDNQPDASAALSVGFTRTQTIVSGLFMSLGVVFAGIWLMRSRKIPVNTAVVAGVLFLGGAAIIAFANVPPGQYPNNLNDHIFSDEFRRYERGFTPIKVKVSDAEKEEFKLIIPRLKNQIEEYKK